MTNIRYVPAKYFQEQLVDKETGAALAAGIVTTYKDQARTELKPLYKKTGTPPNYSYTALPNPFTLSSNGTFVDCGNEINPYFDTEDDSGNIELYYVVVKSSADVLQFTQEGIPDVVAEGEKVADLISYVPDGQFLLHNDIPATPTTDEYEVTEDVTEISQGGWTFERTEGSSAKDLVVFNRIGSATTDPTGNPRYEVNVKCEAPDAGDSEKGLRLKFRDVNKFSSPPDPDNVYTYSFSGKSNSGSASITIYLIKYYGEGGSARERIAQQTFSITGSYVTYNKSITFPDNSLKTIGDNDDDYLQIEIGFNPGVSFDMSFTDFVLSHGVLNITNFPITPSAEQIYQAIAGWMLVPKYDGSDLYLPTVLTKNGLMYDDSVVGFIKDWTCDPNMIDYPPGYLLADGRRLKTDEYSDDGIPYARLQAKYWNPTQKLPIYGTSREFITCTYDGTAPVDKILLTSNEVGVVTTPADGTPATGFTFAVVTPGTVTAKAVFRITTVDASTPIPEGSYFEFYSPALYWPTVILEKKYMCWFSQSGTSTPPTGVGDYEAKIKILFASDDEKEDIADKILEAINKLYYALPDMRGLFTRGWDDGACVDPDSDSKSSDFNLNPPGHDGTGYAVDDYVLADGGVGLTTVFRVTAVGGSGDINNFEMVYNGIGYTNGNTYTTTALTGTGSGAIIHVTEVGGTRDARGDLIDGDAVGTTQDDIVGEHQHYGYVVARQATGGRTGGFDDDPGSTPEPPPSHITQAKGTNIGNETRAKNIYVVKLVHY
jgi:hypothetical protein